MFWNDDIESKLIYVTDRNPQRDRLTMIKRKVTQSDPKRLLNISFK